MLKDLKNREGKKKDYAQCTCPTEDEPFLRDGRSNREDKVAWLKVCLRGGGLRAWFRFTKKHYTEGTWGSEDLGELTLGTLRNDL